ncbi:MAG: TIGR00341 family protein [Spirochaetia bacterium]|nr:TIGR00341 family protein [Spirochaetia bacterium]
MEKEKKPKNKKPDVNDQYRAPGLFPYLYKYFFKKKPEQTGKTENKNIIEKIESAFENYREIKNIHEKNLSTYGIIFESSRLSSEYFILLVGSTLIASFGLLQNSTAVIIGAMIIAPLMTPILGFALGSLWGDRKLMAQSAMTLIVGISGAVFISAIIGLVMPGIEMNDQIVARTNPTLYDIIIALASGFVGSYAFVNPKISSSVSGVAIAVALVPPLAVTGICIGIFQWQSAIGSFLLFASNLVGISLAASFVFWKMKVRPYTEDAGEAASRAKRKILLSVVVLALIAIPLVFFMRQEFYVKNQIQRVEKIIQKELPSEQISTRLNKYLNEYHLESNIVTPANVDLTLKEKIKSDIQKLFDDPVEIKLVIIKSM